MVAATLAAHIAIPPKLLVSLVILVIALIVWGIVALANAGKKPPPSNFGIPFCQTCRVQARWAQTMWFCDRCRQPVQPPMQPGMPQQPPQYGAMPGPPPQYGAMPGQPPHGGAMPGPPQHHAAPGVYGAMPGGTPGQSGAMPGPAVSSTPANGPLCRQCGTPGRWIAESNGWGCDRCRVMLPAA